MKHRKERFDSVIQKELSIIIARELEFDGALATITEVKTADELENATILVSVIPADKKNEVMKILSQSAGDLQYRLMKKIPTRIVPRIFFKYDSGPEKAQQVEKIIIDGEKSK